MIDSTAVNGIPVICETNSFFRSVSFGIWINAGSRDETAEKAGLFHFLEHLVFKGTLRRDARSINVEIDELGGHVDAFTTREYTCYSAHVLAENLEQTFDLVADIMLNSVFPDDEVERERHVILEEIKMGEDSPAENIFDQLYPTRWSGHPLGRLITGTVGTVKSITKKDLQDARERYYRPPFMLVTASGGVEIGALAQLVDKYFGGLPQGIASRSFPELVTKNTVNVIKRPLEQAHLIMAGPGLSMADERRNELAILNTVLGGGASSRLFQKIREEMGLAYSIHSFFDQFVETGIFGVYVACSPQFLEKMWTALHGELSRLLKEPPGEEEVARAKKMHLRGLKMSFESPSSRMYQMASQKMYLNTALTHEEMISEIEDVTPEKVNGLAEGILKDGAYTVLALGPISRWKKAKLRV